MTNSYSGLGVLRFFHWFRIFVQWWREFFLHEKTDDILSPFVPFLYINLQNESIIKQHHYRLYIQVAYLQSLQ